LTTSAHGGIVATHRHPVADAGREHALVGTVGTPSVTNALVTNQDIRLQVLSMKQYGATGNGTTDDRAAIQAAIDAAAAVQTFPSAGAAVSAPAPTMAKLGNTAQPSGARCVVGASGAAAGWRRVKVPGSAVGDPTFHTLVHSEPGTVYVEPPGAREIPRGSATSVPRRALA
jgi:hypothetical protein